MCTKLDINTEYVVIYRDKRRTLALKMDLDVEAPNILDVNEHCAFLPDQPSKAMSFKNLAVGDRLWVTQIQSEKEDFAIPLCTRKNRVHWLESAPPRAQALAAEACVTKKAERIEKAVFTRTIHAGKPCARGRFFDPYKKHERNLPGDAEAATTKYDGLTRVTFAKIPAGSYIHTRIMCVVPVDYPGQLTHYEPTGEGTHFAATQESVYDPISFTMTTDSELLEFTKLLAAPAICTDDATRDGMLIAAAALVKCCADKEWRQGDHPSVLSVAECTRIVQKHAYPDLEQPKCGILAKLLKAALTRLTRKEDEEGTSSTTFIE